jgi:hypothetical protein
MIVQWRSQISVFHFVLEPVTLYQLLYPYPVGERIEVMGTGSVGLAMMQSALHAKRLVISFYVRYICVTRLNK